MIIETNAKEFVLDIGKITSEVERRLNATMIRGTMKLDEELKKGTPVRTGNLRRSWHFDIKGKFETENYNTAPYVRHVEHGTRYFQGRHFVQAVEDRVQEIYDEAWDRSK